MISQFSTESPSKMQTCHKFTLEFKMKVINEAKKSKNKRKTADANSIETIKGGETIQSREEIIQGKILNQEIRYCSNLALHTYESFEKPNRYFSYRHQWFMMKLQKRTFVLLTRILF